MQSIAPHNCLIGDKGLVSVMVTESRRHKDPTTLPVLTAKQREVMTLVVDNRTSKEIASLLGLSDSAVNQRIEQIRARMGGIPRGEIARLYRQEFARERSVAATFPPTWEKIQVQDAAQAIQGGDAEGRSGAALLAKASAAGATGSGSQPSQTSFPAEFPDLGREGSPSTVRQIVFIAIIVVIGVIIAGLVTEALAGTISQS